MFYSASLFSQAPLARGSRALPSILLVNGMSKVVVLVQKRCEYVLVMVINGSFIARYVDINLLNHNNQCCVYRNYVILWIKRAGCVLHK